ncbi:MULTISPECIES: SigE family RNA polymerase sigma factor [unclassified Streptomyces]|uniref:SigE family RNA polymerase sigma factor n=1 Tax=Streptomycetaceae TaxID=2062 RepID=UPI002E7779F4|nr:MULTISPECIES: SigE family RNA polymerase sigma factor [unclassified Streptomyces]MED7947920.1 SigE family RNA polymerase sigma factor [Streptomyces sp. BE303]MEE1823299.1 SigE family RNA polymerase sigma factor [Streptomyces sp. BE20]
MKRESMRPDGTTGDPFDEFVAARYQALLRGAFLITGDVHDARDLLHDALARVYARRGAIRDPGATEGYVRKAMVRTHVSRWRRTRREVLTPQLPDTPVAAVDARDEQLERALRSLSPRQRTAVVLRYYADRSVAQVAEELGCSLTTARTHLARAMKTLRQELAPAKEMVGHDG